VGGGECVYIQPCEREEALWLCVALLMFWLFMPKATVRLQSGRRNERAVLVSWTSHRRPTPFTALGARATAVAMDGVRLESPWMAFGLRDAISSCNSGLAPGSLDHRHATRRPMAML
jgi:hypothetical protein